MRKTALAALSAAAAFATAGAQTPQIQIDKNNRTITINTSDEASMIADVAVLTVGYNVTRPSAPEAYTEGSKLSNSIFAALLEAGIPKNAIQSASQNLSEQDDDSNPKKGKIAVYEFSQSWTVRVPADAAAKTLDSAVKAGANNAGNIDWNVADEDALQGKAAENALQKARTIAAQMAHGLNVKIGALLYASNQAPQRLFSKMNTMSADVSPRDRKAPTPPPVLEAPKVEKTATVYAVFAIE